MRLWLTLICTYCLFSAHAQQHKVLVHFCDKDYAGYEPYAYLSEKAIARRIAHNLPIKSFSDAPVNPDYVASMANLMDSVKVVSRWLNGVVGFAPKEALEEIAALPYVANIEQLPHQDLAICSVQGAEEIDLDLMSRQVDRMGGDVLLENNLNGAGVLIAVFDAGFPQVNTSPWFHHIRSEGRIKHTYDFVKKRENVYLGSEHGTGVLSCIAGAKGELRMGVATGAAFMLARTERALLEPFSEEENWLKAAEWADKHGADIISSSLGYTFHRYFPEEMDGQTSLVAKAARMATRKGILVVNAAGNEGDSEWRYMVTPADVDSVLAVGGIDPETEIHIDFSSYGPNVKMQRKPDVSAYGEAIMWWKDGLKEMPGTSFATPLVVGFAACVKQQNPQATNMELFDLIVGSGELSPYYDYAHGTGMPQASKIMSMPADTIETLQLTYADYELTIDLFSSHKKDTSEFAMFLPEPTNYLYIHKSDSTDQLAWYKVIAIRGQSRYDLKRFDFNQGDVIRAHYLGQTKTVEIE